MCFLDRGKLLLAGLNAQKPMHNELRTLLLNRLLPLMLPLILILLIFATLHIFVFIWFIVPLIIIANDAGRWNAYIVPIDLIKHHLTGPRGRRPWTTTSNILQNIPFYEIAELHIVEPLNSFRFVSHHFSLLVLNAFLIRPSSYTLSNHSDLVFVHSIMQPCGYVSGRIRSD